MTDSLIYLTASGMVWAVESSGQCMETLGAWKRWVHGNVGCMETLGAWNRRVIRISGKDFLDHFSVDIGESKITASVPIGQLFVIDSQ